MAHTLKSLIFLVLLQPFLVGVSLGDKIGQKNPVQDIKEDKLQNTCIGSSPPLCQQGDSKTPDDRALASQRDLAIAACEAHQDNCKAYKIDVSCEEKLCPLDVFSNCGVGKGPSTKENQLSEDILKLFLTNLQVIDSPVSSKKQLKREIRKGKRRVNQLNRKMTNLSKEGEDINPHLDERWRSSFKYKLGMKDSFYCYKEELQDESLCLVVGNAIGDFTKRSNIKEVIEVKIGEKILRISSKGIGDESLKGIRFVLYEASKDSKLEKKKEKIVPISISLKEEGSSGGGGGFFSNRSLGFVKTSGSSGEALPILNKEAKAYQTESSSSVSGSSSFSDSPESSSSVQISSPLKVDSEEKENSRSIPDLKHLATKTEKVSLERGLSSVSSKGGGLQIVDGRPLIASYDNCEEAMDISLKLSSSQVLACNAYKDLEHIKGQKAQTRYFNQRLQVKIKSVLDNDYSVKDLKYHRGELQVLLNQMNLSKGARRRASYLLKFMKLKEQMLVKKISEKETLLLLNLKDRISNVLLLSKTKVLEASHYEKIERIFKFIESKFNITLS